jgi:hypothetical protein
MRLHSGWALRAIAAQLAAEGTTLHFGGFPLWLWRPRISRQPQERHVVFNLRSLDLNLLTVFEAIYEIGTVSGAADRVALSQSATSHALSRLRDACKDDLFVRAGQGLSPTPVAQEMYLPINRR